MIPQLLTNAARIRIALNFQANRIISSPVLARRIVPSLKDYSSSSLPQRLLVFGTRVRGPPLEARLLWGDVTLPAPCQSGGGGGAATRGEC